MCLGKKQRATLGLYMTKGIFLLYCRFANDHLKEHFPQRSISPHAVTIVMSFSAVFVTISSWLLDETCETMTQS